MKECNSRVKCSICGRKDHGNALTCPLMYNHSEIRDLYALKKKNGKTGRTIRSHMRAIFKHPVTEKNLPDILRRCRQVLHIHRMADKKNKVINTKNINTSGKDPVINRKEVIVIHDDKPVSIKQLDKLMGSLSIGASMGTQNNNTPS
jgi:hypothetical protein